MYILRRCLQFRETALPFNKLSRLSFYLFQVLCEELARKAANLTLENENLKRVHDFSPVCYLLSFFVSSCPSLPSSLTLLCFIKWGVYSGDFLFYKFSTYFYSSLLHIWWHFWWKEKELALKEYQSLETTNKNLKAQVRCSSPGHIFKHGLTINIFSKKEERKTDVFFHLQITESISSNAEVEKTPVELESSVAHITTTSSSNSPWFLYNHFPVINLFCPSIIGPLILIGHVVCSLRRVFGHTYHTLLVCIFIINLSSWDLWG